jgi:hypothetical protein
MSAFLLAPVQAADEAETPGLIDKVETEAGELEQTAKEKAEAAAAAVASEAETLASEAVSEGKELGREAVDEAEKLGEEALTTGEAVIKKEAPGVEATAKEVEEKAAELDRKWEPVIQKDVEADAAKVGHAISAEAALARARIAAGSLWLAAYLRNVEKNGKLKISDEILKLNLLSPGLGTHVIDEMRYLKRASQLEIKKGETAVEREGARLLRKSRDDLQATGRWVREEVGEGEAKLESAAIKAKRAILAEENKADFWLEGRPLSDIKAEAVIAHNNLLVSNEFPSATLCAECHPANIASGPSRSTPTPSSVPSSTRCPSASIALPTAPTAIFASAATPNPAWPSANLFSSPTRTVFPLHARVSAVSSATALKTPTAASAAAMALKRETSPSPCRARAAPMSSRRSSTNSTSPPTSPPARSIGKKMAPR